MTTVNYQVGANNDDADERQDGANFSASQSIITADSNTASTARWVSGHRLTNVVVPKNAQIVTAKIQIYPGTQDDVNIDIFAEDVDDAVDFASNADVNSRVLTSASSSWVADAIGTDGYSTSPEIKAVIQEIVDRASWASGNDIVIILKGKSDVNKLFNTFGHDLQPTQTLKLDIEYAVTRKRSYARAIL